MNTTHIGLVSCVGLLLLCAFIGIASVTISGAEVTELNVHPEVGEQGEIVLISGKASPNEEVWIGSSFAISLPVSDGKYSREFSDIEFPKGEKTFSVTAENVKNIRVSLSPVFLQTIEYPLDGALNATEGIATLSISFPAELFGVKMDIYGKKDVKVYGDAVDTTTSVNLNVATSIKVIADSNGDFTLDIDTEGVPRGEFLITAGGIEKTIHIGSAESTPTPTPSASPAPSPSPFPTPTSTPREPGFEAVFAIAGLLAVAYLVLCRRNFDD